MLLRSGHRVTLLVGGAEFFPALLQALDAAQVEIRLETYIFRMDPTGALVVEALEHAARRGVAVYFLMDGVGTPALAPELQQRLHAAGVHWMRYAPLGMLGLVLPGRWRRLHRKLCVVDRQLAFCGGINILDDYFELGHGWQPTPRLDFAVQVTGPLVQDIWLVMEQLWRRVQSVWALEHGHLGSASSGWWGVAPPPDIWPVTGAAATAPAAGADARVPVRDGVSASLVLRDNVRYRSRIERVYCKAIAHAQSEILIANAYFMPGARLRNALVHAAQRGVRVRLLLPGRYEFFMQFHAGKPLYKALLDAGMEIYEYQYSYLHAKVAVIDGQWATVGSSNMDPLSLLLAREANVVLDDPDFAGVLRQYLCDAMQQHSEPVRRDSLLQRRWHVRLRDWLAYRLLRLSLVLAGKNY